MGLASRKMTVTECLPSGFPTRPTTGGKDGKEVFSRTISSVELSGSPQSFCFYPKLSSLYLQLQYNGFLIEYTDAKPILGHLRDKSPYRQRQLSALHRSVFVQNSNLNIHRTHSHNKGDHKGDLLYLTRNPSWGHSS